jgi:hypothetical protein
MLQLFSNTAAHLQPACSQHAASMQHTCSMPHDSTLHTPSYSAQQNNINDVLSTTSTISCPPSAHSSLKQARLLFNCNVGAASNGNGNCGSAGGLLAASQAFLSPLSDRNATLRKSNIERKIQLLYPGETEKLAFHHAMVAV